MSSRTEEAQKTRDAIVAAAMELFAEQGLSGPSLDAICARAGYTRGAFYVHFASRDELIAAVVEHAVGGFIDAMIASGEAGADVPTIVRTFAAAVTSGAFPFAGSVRTHNVLEACQRSPMLRAKYLEQLARARHRLADTFRRGQAAGSLRDDLDPDSIAELLVALVFGVQVACELGAPHGAARTAEDLLRMFAPGPPSRS